MLLLGNVFCYRFLFVWIISTNFKIGSFLENENFQFLYSYQNWDFLLPWDSESVFCFRTTY